ncbi:uncharacterized protein LOC136087772 [Hydra vulgaris]|uniref:Uncharacterized protein LOC136087772 n=1 Tax=Hydra vulgaris TaxID=6087 RepID=A0ABM4CZD1_HYDVU
MIQNKRVATCIYSMMRELATCISCRSQIGKFCDGKTTVGPKLYHFETFLIKPATRFSNVCECLLCQIAKLKGKEKHPFSKFQDSEPTLPQQASQSAEKRCTKCLPIIKRGLPHNCTLGTHHENLRKIAAADPVRAEQVASTVLVSKSASPNGTIRLSQTSGKMLSLRRGPSSAQQIFKEPLTTENMVQIQQNTGLSNNGMRKLGSVLNQVSPVRFVVSL